MNPSITEEFSKANSIQTADKERIKNLVLNVKYAKSVSFDSTNKCWSIMFQTLKKGKVSINMTYTIDIAHLIGDQHAALKSYETPEVESPTVT